MSDFKVPAIIRGQIIEDYEVEYGGRNGSLRFVTPDLRKHLNRLLDTEASALDDLYEISLDEILDFLGRVGRRLDLDRNPHWREAFEASCKASNLSRPVLERVYRNCAEALQPDILRETIELRIGARYLEGWVPHHLRSDGRTFYVRAMGARAVHIIAGNVPIVAAYTLVRNAYTRSDAIVKLPSNDPLTMVALARTMIEEDPNHPLTRHLSVAYWKGGEEAIEKEIYVPRHIEKIVAWGGFASIKHVSKYLQPGIDLVTMDPKNSTTLIGREVFQTDQIMRDVAARVAVDMGGLDQEGCVNARVMFIESGTDAEGISASNRFGEYLFEALQRLPKSISSGPVTFDPVLRAEIEAIIPLTDFYRVYCDPRNIQKSGAVIVSQMGEQVDFPRLLYGRVGNLVPVDDIEDVVERFTPATQTVGIFPDALRIKLRDRAALRGGQMMVPVGYAISGNAAAPQDGIEPERRMCRWVVDSHCDPAVTPGPWLPEDEAAAIRDRTLQASGPVLRDRTMARERPTDAERA